MGPAPQLLLVLCRKFTREYLKETSALAKLFLANFLRKQADQSPRLLRLLWAIEAGLVATLSRLSRLLSPDFASATGYRLLHTIGPHLDKTRLIRRNVNIAFPEKSAAEVDKLVEEIWGNLGAVLAEFPHLGAICGRKAGRRLEFTRKGNAQVFKQQGKPAVFVSAHLANWEIAAAAIVLQKVPLAVVYTPIQNPWMDKMLRSVRTSLGCELIDRTGAVRQLIRRLKAGTSVGLIVDQRVDGGEAVPFFGHDMMTAVTPAQLAVRFDCELIPVQIQRLEGARFRAIFHKPVDADDQAADDHEKVLQMTKKINTLFESWIRERPQEWMCSKRRWPKDL